jgi:hypothetical protein
MIIIGVDFHPEFQQMASVDTDTGEFQEKRLVHREDAETFYHALAGKKVRVGRSSASHGAQSAGMAQSLFPPDAAARAEDCQGSHGTSPGGSSVLDVASGMGLQATYTVRFARGTARTSPWCAAKHRVIDWASRSPSAGGV